MSGLGLLFMNLMFVFMLLIVIIGRIGLKIFFFISGLFSDGFSIRVGVIVGWDLFSLLLYIILMFLR